MDNISAAVDWLLNSGIQNTSGDHAGGFNGWFDLDAGSYPFVYSEITGYGITTLLFAHSIRKENIFIGRAELAARWVIGRAMHECGGARTRAYNSNPDAAYSFENNIIYIFDNGMILPALVNLHSITGKGEHLEAAKRIADFLISMQKPDGMFYAAYDANNDRRIDSSAKWSSQSGSYHAKLAIGMADLYKTTKEEKYRQSAESICNASLKLQDNSGRFVTQKDEKSTHMHPHCYSAEGLLYAGATLNESRFIDSAAKATRWSLESQLPSGGVPCKFASGFNTNERSDTLAQVLRLAVYLNSVGLIKFEKEIERLHARLLDFQKKDGAHKGGFFYGTELDGTRRNHINSWCSFFALQALQMHAHFKNRSKIGLNLLI